MVGEIVARNISNQACGVQGYPTAVAVAPDGLPIRSSRRFIHTAFELHPWIRLMPHGAPVVTDVSTADGQSQCRSPIVEDFVIHIGHHGGVATVEAPSNRGCDGVKRSGPYLVSTGYWTRRRDPDFTSDQHLKVTLSRVQRRVQRGGTEHFAITFSGKDVRAVLHPCLPVIINLSPQGKPVVQRRTLLNCAAVSKRRLRTITFQMQLPVPRHTPHRLDVDVEWPVAIDGIYDALDDGQYLPITITN